MDSEGDRWMVIYSDATLEEIALVRSLIESTDRIFRGNNELMTIIEDVAPLYLNGDRTLEDTLRIIQSRVQVYVSEQSWQNECKTQGRFSCTVRKSGVVFSFSE